MPRVKLCDENAQRKKEIKSTILKEGISIRKIANISGMNEQTLYFRMKHPETFRLSEIWAIERYLKIEIF